MNNHEKEVVSARVLGLLFISVLCAILSAGLWPFHAPKNDVSWLKNQNGLYFGHYGSVLSSGGFKPKHSTNDNACSLEIWLQPGPIGISSNLLTLTTSGTPVVPFLLYQWTDHLVLKYTRLDPERREQTENLVVGGVFHEGKRVFVTITSGVQGTAVYLNGAPVDESRTFRILSNGFAGRLVLADKGGWSGQLLGFAFYDSELSDTEVLRHYESWTKNQHPRITAKEKPIALYRFNERRGNAAHNEIDSSTDLVIPDRYFVLHPAFLVPPWKEFRPDWDYWKDIAINIAGFIPLGFFFRAYRFSARKTEPGAMSAVILGFTISFTIELLQGFLPTRDSGTTDILTNTLGTGIGAILFSCRVVPCLFKPFNAQPIRLAIAAQSQSPLKPAGLV